MGHCCSNVNPLRSNFEDCCPAPDGTNDCSIVYPVGVNDPEPDRLPVLSVVAPMVQVFSTNGDGNIETLDAALYLTDYANADPMTDLNLDTIQTTDDMSIFLESYSGE